MKPQSAINQQGFGESFPFAFILRFIGVGIVFFGIMIAYEVVSHAWELFEDQKRIVEFAATINEHSQVDDWLNHVQTPGMLENQFKQVSKALEEAGGGGATVTQQVQAQTVTGTQTSVKFSYFFAWLLTLMLLGLIAKVGTWIIVTGGKLALYGGEKNQELKKLLKELLAEREA